MDVSWYQRGLDWQQQWNMGARFAYVKASEGNYYTNPSYADQYQGSRAVGMIRGAYHFAIPNWSSGADQARYFVQNGGGWVSDGFTLPPVLDFEFNPYAGETIEGFYFGNTCYDMSPAQLTSWVRDFGNTMKSLTGRLPVIYTNTSWWKQCTGDAAGFGDYPLWVASYPSSPSNDAGPIPSSWGSYDIWQYSSTGPYSGDSNTWNGDYTSLKEFAGAPAAGSFDDLTMTRDGGTVYLRSRGWAVDLARPWVSSDVHIYVTDPSNVTTGYAFRADAYRPDVDQAYGYGPAHGFDSSVRITASGSYKVCAYAIATFGNKLLACKTFQASGVEPPMGSFDGLGQVRTPDKVSLRLTGWAIDRANPQTSTSADAYVTGPDGKTTGYRMPADVARPDVDSAYRLGSAHGFDKLIDITLPGSYQVCVYAIGQYSNTALGCRQLLVEANPPPVGAYDTLSVVQTPGAAKLQVTGWALDKAKPAGSVPVHIYVKSPDGANVGYAFTADKPRSDVNNALGVVGNHGFQSTIDISSTGIYTVCSYAIPIAPLPSSPTSLGCKTIQVSNTPPPRGYVDNVSVQIVSGARYGILTQGWTYDPGVPGSSNPVHVYLTYPDGTRSGFAFTADQPRDDVNAAFGISGNHGYATFVPITQRGQYSVCAYGVGIAEFSSGNTLLGCKSLNY
jgi:GH25 family lysozyme M1 (1,4-beta-N-acetylmuramidase)